MAREQKSTAGGKSERPLRRLIARLRPRREVRRDIPFDAQRDARPEYQDPRPGLNTSGFQIGGH